MLIKLWNIILSIILVEFPDLFLVEDVVKLNKPRMSPEIL